MNHKGWSGDVFFGVAIAVVALMFTSIAFASSPTETTLYNFLGIPDGENSASPLVFDKVGNIYGTTQGGGSLGYGAVFELSPPTVQGGAWTEAVLYSFPWGNDGLNPSSGLIFDGKGALFGETLYGGVGNRGIIFKLTPPAVQGDSWNETTIYSFCASGTCTDGQTPSGGLVFDKKGNVYGTTQYGGSAGCGVVFELAKPNSQQGNWTETVLHNFCVQVEKHPEGRLPQNGVIFDKAGNLYGTTAWGGGSSVCSNGCGTVFELSIVGALWTERALYAFQGNGDGNIPASGLIFDSLGALYGTTGGTTGLNFGNVFKLTPHQGGAWSESVVYTFQGAQGDAYYPGSGVTFKGKDLYGTTQEGGSALCSYGSQSVGCGTIFKLTPPKTGTGMWTETIEFNFQGGIGGNGGGANPMANLTLKNGAFYGTTYYGSSAGSGCPFGCGVAFELVP